MAYITAQETAQIRKKLKEQFPEFKFSVRTEHNMKVDVAIMEGNEDFSEILEGAGRASINHYWLDDHYSPEHAKLFKEMLEVIRYGSDNKWFDKSDAMTDYFHTAFYISLGIGRYNKPYKQKVRG